MLEAIERKRMEREQERVQRREKRRVNKDEEAERRHSFLKEASSSLFPDGCVLSPHAIIAALLI